jgi:hypothetical protein
MAFPAFSAPNPVVYTWRQIMLRLLRMAGVKRKPTEPVVDLIERRDEMVSANPELAGSFAAFQKQFSQYLEVSRQFENKAGDTASVKAAGTYHTE